MSVSLRGELTPSLKKFSSKSSHHSALNLLLLKLRESKNEENSQITESDHRLLEKNLFPVFLCNMVATNDLEGIKQFLEEFGKSQSLNVTDYDRRSALVTHYNLW